MSAELEAIQTDDAPAAVGPYSQAMRAGQMIFCSGQLPIDPRTGKLIEGDDIGEHTRQIFANLAAVLKAAGAGLEQVVATQVFVTDLGGFAALNAVYAECFGEHQPARATVEVSALPLGAAVEISCTAMLPG